MKIANRALKMCALCGLAGAVALVMTTGMGAADIADFMSVDSGSDAEFIRVLETMGHDRFETYEINGQTIHTSVRHVEHRTPVQLAGAYQMQLAAHGVNDRVYHRLESGTWEQRLFTGLKGGLVPFRHSPEHVAMGGVLTHDRLVHDQDVVEAMASMASSETNFRGFRNIEFMRPPQSLRTTVVATWSEDLDFDAMEAGSQALQSGRLDSDVAACSGCTRVHHFEHPRRSAEDHGVHVFVGPRSAQFYREWFRDRLETEGFSPDGFDGLAGSAAFDVGLPQGGEVLVFRRGDVERTVTLREADQDTFIHVHTYRATKRPDWSVQ